MHPRQNRVGGIGSRRRSREEVERKSRGKASFTTDRNGGVGTGQGLEERIERTEREIEGLRQRPLLVVCKTPAGKWVKTTVGNCIRRGYWYVHIACDDLDALLDREINDPLCVGKFLEMACEEDAPQD